MHFDADLLLARRPAMIAAGLWPDRTINDALDAAAASAPDRRALAGCILLDVISTSVSVESLMA